MSDEQQKVAIVTGASQGIGAGLVAEYRKQGWAVVAVSRSIKPLGDPQVLTVDGDVSEIATADRVVRAALDRFGRVDTLINNAGIYISKPFTSYTPEDYAAVVGVNLTGFFALTQRAIVEMLQVGGGHVVNISTTLADYANSSAPSVLTSLTKGGLASATRSLAIEFATRGIRVNAVSPGIIQTEVHSVESYADLGTQLPPVGHVGQIRDIVNGIYFLESSPFITGEVLHIDGGQIAGHLTNGSVPTRGVETLDGRWLASPDRGDHDGVDRAMSHRMAYGGSAPAEERKRATGTCRVPSIVEGRALRADIVAGADFPDYQLEDHGGVLRTLSELQGGNPMVLHLSRGSYDPEEHRFLRNLVDCSPEFRVAYTRLVVICTDSPLNLNEFRDSLGAPWPFLGDPERTVQRDLEIEEYTDPHNPMIPHTFVLEPGLRIFSIYNGYWYWGRPTMDELHVDLRSVLRATRPDFDLNAPGLREAWDRGDRDQFLVDTLDPPIRYTEGGTIGIKRGGL